MTNIIQGQLTAAGERFAIVVSRFNELITERLTAGAVGTITRLGGDTDTIDVYKVPGSFEIPLTASRVAASKKYSAVICLGAVIQGSTSHHEYINSQVAAGLMAVMQSTGTPVTFGVITCESMDQALDRAGGKVGNKGEEAATAAVEMISLLKQING
ncbi:MAG: 6,7-dimethyl-8-ribityllumazine synthase [Fuerstiella sp.]|nr:6,7-dimethyl-8-ribityllumazine synthase [Fuerstiella sp.]